jgi:hypothetical protein
MSASTSLYLLVSRDPDLLLRLGSLKRHLAPSQITRRDQCATILDPQERHRRRPSQKAVLKNGVITLLDDGMLTAANRLENLYQNFGRAVTRWPISVRVH